MSSIYLPDSIYERLPKIYLGLAVLLAVVPSTSVKWLAVAGLVLATVAITRRRRAYRDAELVARSTAMMQKYRQEPKESITSALRGRLLVP